MEIPIRTDPKSIPAILPLRGKAPWSFVSFDEFMREAVCGVNGLHRRRFNDAPFIVALCDVEDHIQHDVRPLKSSGEVSLGYTTNRILCDLARA